MDNKLLLAKCVTLLYKESLLNDNETNSKSLVNEAISKIQTRDIGLGIPSDTDAILSLKETVRDMLTTPHDHGIDKAELLQRIRINVGDNDKLYQAIENGIQSESDQDVLRKSILNLRRSIENHLKELKVSEVLTSAASSWNYQREKIPDTRDFLTTVWRQLEPFTALRAREDPAIIDEVRLGNQEQVNKVISNIYTSVVENRVYKTGWQGLNRMMQGGIRPGEFWMQAALQHKYKTGFSQSIFNQVAIYNKPMTNIQGRKPALVLYAFEDTTVERFKFIVKQLQYTATREAIEVGDMKMEDMQSIIYSKLRVNGFEIFFYRVDPTKWTYSDLFRHTLEIEQKGYSIEFVMIDYLEKLPTIGCVSSGPMGNDLLDLFTRVRMFYNAKGIACWTPHQLSTECKKLIRGSVTEDKLVQVIVGRGYYKGSSQLDQIPDGLLITHIFPYNDKWYLAIQRDRHRISSIIPEKYKYMLLEFPKDMPIPDDLTTNETTLYKLPAYASNVESDFLKFDS